MTTLYEHLDQVLAPEDADSDRFTVTDERSADWAARRVQHHHQAIAEKRAERDEIVAAADDWLARETKAHADSAEYLEGLLCDWLRGEIEADPKGKVSRKLPCGVTVKRTPAGESLTVDDEEALVRFLAENEDTAELVEFVPKYSKAAVKKLVTQDGLAVPGVHIERGVHGWKVTL